MPNDSRLDYHDPEWVAQQLGIDKNTVYRYLDEGTLPGLRLGRKWLISEASLTEFLKREEQEQTERRRAGLRRGKPTPFAKFIRRANQLPITERAENALTGAWEEAIELRHNYIGQEHLLLGFTHEPESVAAKVLRNLGFDVRSTVESLIGRGRGPIASDIHLTPRARQTMELAVEEAHRLGHRYLGTEHVLLGIMRAGEGIGFELLMRHDIGEERLRAEMNRILSQPRREAKENPAQGEHSLEG